jgi:hypothetical protein
MECKKKLVSKLLGTIPPEIDPLEKSLARLTRTVLSQVRSTYCNQLKDYPERIGSAQDDIRPVCCGAPHTAEHIFDCPAAPTNLTKLDLWRRPREMASFFQTLLPFADLPLNPPLPPLPPERPPVAQATLD